VIAALLLLVPAVLLWIPTPSSGGKRSFVIAAKAVVSAVILVLVLGFAVLYYPRSFTTPSDAQLLFEQASPSSDYVAGVFQDGGHGATVEISRFVSLRTKGQSWNPGRDLAVFQIDDEPKINLAWTSDDALEIEHSPSVVEMKAAKWNGIIISDISPGQIPGPVSIGQGRAKNDAILVSVCALALSTAFFWLRGERRNPAAWPFFACRVVATLAWIGFCAYVIYQSRVPFD